MNHSHLKTCTHDSKQLPKSKRTRPAIRTVDSRKMGEKYTHVRLVLRTVVRKRRSRQDATTNTTTISAFEVFLKDVNKLCAEGGGRLSVAASTTQKCW